MANILTVYYSRMGQNYLSGSVRDLKKGSTEYASEVSARR